MSHPLLTSMGAQAHVRLCFCSGLVASSPSSSDPWRALLLQITAPGTAAELGFQGVSKRPSLSVSPAPIRWPLCSRESALKQGWRAPCFSLQVPITLELPLRSHRCPCGLAFPWDPLCTFCSCPVALPALLNASVDRPPTCLRAGSCDLCCFLSPSTRHTWPFSESTPGCCWPEAL